jgi:hypothetical protein
VIARAVTPSVGARDSENAAESPTARVGSLSARRFRKGSTRGGIVWHGDQDRYGQISTGRR